TVVVGLALIVGAFGVLAGLRQKLTDDVETTARLRAEDVVALLQSGTAPERLAIDDEEDSAIQVLDGQRRTIGGSTNVVHRPAMADVPAGGATTVDDLIMSSGAYRVVAVDAPRGKDRFTVLAAESLEPVDEGSEVVIHAFAIGVPLLMLLVAGITWIVTGRALRPVEAIREEVGAISDEDDLGRRVPEPSSGDEVARLAHTMNEMLARLETARARQQRFVSDASHELRSPLATIRHELELLMTDLDRSEHVPMAEGLMAECLRMQSLVDDLLLLARSDEGSPARRRAVDLDDLVLAEAARLRSRALVQVDTAQVSAGQVTGDAGQLTRMVRNLADNAERHARGLVGFDLRGHDGVVVLAVRDDGPGVASADRERVFERFTRLDAARARGTGGSGLGLAIVAQVAAAHDGSVAVDDAPGGGARFTVTLPSAR
ncbi:MAG: HAMP domain-containing histidine kinase, partial [Acidimicrobiia bacterium]|nr:HAMP domain-containing histidine kinase [Acidimicrobiia bacterium]